MRDLTKQEVLNRAQELVDEFRAKGGIEEPIKVVEGERAAYFRQNSTIAINPETAKIFAPDEFRAVIAHEVGHASDRENVHAANKKEVAKAGVAIAVSLVAGQVSPALALPGLVYGVNKLREISGGGKLYAAEEHRADRFAIEKLGIDPIVMKQAFDRDCSTQPDHDKAWFKKQAEKNKTYLNEAVNARLGELQQAPQKSQDVVRSGGQKVETTSTGRIPSRFSRPPSPDAIAQARQEPPPRARSSGRSM